MKNTINRKSIISLILAFAIIFPGFAAFTEVKAASEGCHTAPRIEQLKIDNYRLTKNDAGQYTTFPTSDDMIFAGWYEDDACTIPLDKSVTDGKYYAKFVPEHIFSIKAQVSANLFDSSTSNDEKASLRFVTSIDSRDYSKLLFSIKTENDTTRRESQEDYVYKQLYYIAGERVQSYKPADIFCTQSQYFKAYTIKGIPSSYFDSKINAQVFFQTLDGTYVKASERDVCVNDAFKYGTNEYQSIFNGADGWDFSREEAGVITLPSGGDNFNLKLAEQQTNMDLSLWVEDNPTATGNPRTDVRFDFENGKWISFGVVVSGDKVTIQSMGDNTDAITGNGWPTHYTLTAEEKEQFKTTEGIEFRIKRVGTMFYIYLGDKQVKTLDVQYMNGDSSRETSGVTADTKATVSIRHWGDSGADIEMPFNFKAEAVAYTSIFNGAAGWNFSREEAGVITLPSGGDNFNLKLAEQQTDMDLSLWVEDNPTATGEPRNDVRFDFENNKWISFGVVVSGDKVTIQSMGDNNAITGNGWPTHYTLTAEEKERFKTTEGIEFRIKRVGTMFYIYLGDKQVKTLDVQYTNGDSSKDASEVTADTKATVSIRHWGDKGVNIEMPFNFKKEAVAYTSIFNGATGWDFSREEAGVITLTNGGNNYNLKLAEKQTNMDLSLWVEDNPNGTGASKNDVRFTFENGKWISFGIEDENDDVVIKSIGGENSLTPGWNRWYYLTEEEKEQLRSEDGIEFRIKRLGTAFYIYLGEKHVKTVNAIYETPANKGGTSGVTASTKAEVLIRHDNDSGVDIAMPFTFTTEVTPECPTIFNNADGWDFSEEKDGRIALMNGGDNFYLKLAEKQTSMDLSLWVENNPNAADSAQNDTPRTDVKFTFDNGRTLTFGVLQKKGNGDVVIQSMGDDGKTLTPGWNAWYTFTAEEKAKFQSADGIEFRIKRMGTMFYLYIGGKHVKTLNAVYEIPSNEQGTSGVTADTKATVSIRHWGDSGTTIDMPFKFSNQVTSKFVPANNYDLGREEEGILLKKGNNNSTIALAKQYADVDVILQARNLGAGTDAFSGVYALFEFDAKNKIEIKAFSSTSSGNAYVTIKPTIAGSQTTAAQVQLNAANGGLVEYANAIKSPEGAKFTIKRTGAVFEAYLGEKLIAKVDLAERLSDQGISANAKAKVYIGHDMDSAANKTIEVPFEIIGKKKLTPYKKSELFYQNTKKANGSDPFVLDNTTRDGYYYMYVTYGDYCLKSKNLTDWQVVGNPLASITGEAANVIAADRWAPEVVYDNGKYYMFFSATPKQEDTIESLKVNYQLFVAVSDKPDRGYSLVDFTDEISCGAENTHSYNESTYNKYFTKYLYLSPSDYKPGSINYYEEAIDPHPYVDTDGEKYLFWTWNGGNNEIYAVRMRNKNWMTPDWTSLKKITKAGYETVDSNSAKISYEQDTTINEGATITKYKNKYYLTYSIGTYKDNSYRIAQAVSDNVLGPYRKLSEDEGAILLSAELSGSTSISGTGHHSIVTVGNQMYIFYHRHDDASVGGDKRNIALDEVKWVQNNNGLDVMYVNGPTNTLQPKIEAFNNGYKNIAAQAYLTGIENADFLTDGLVSVRTNDISAFANVSKNVNISKKTTLTYTFSNPKELCAVMIYGSGKAATALQKIARIELDCVEEYNETVTYYTETISRNLEDAMISGNAITMVLNQKSVKAIRITIDPEDQEEVAISEIKLIGK